MFQLKKKLQFKTNTQLAASDPEGTDYNFGHIKRYKGTCSCLFWPLAVHSAASCGTCHSEWPQSQGTRYEIDEPRWYWGYQKCPSLHPTPFPRCQIRKLFAGLVSYFLDPKLTTGYNFIVVFQMKEREGLACAVMYGLAFFLICVNRVLGTIYFSEIME